MLWTRHTNDATLVRDVLGGRHDQFALLVERHLPSVLAIAGARVQCRADAADAALKIPEMAETLGTNPGHSPQSP